MKDNENHNTDKKIHAYEREPVPEDQLKGWWSFWGLFISRHTAGTEFAIGPLFVARGATAIDVIVGLAIGNLLATLSWRYVTAPLAVKQRLTTYFSMELAVGKKLLYLYDIFSCLVLAGLAGAMFTVSGTAFAAILDIPSPELTDMLPTSASFCAVVIVCGLVTTLIAAFGFTYVTIFGQLMTPILIAGIIYLCVMSLQILQLNVDGCDMWCILTEKVYTGDVVNPSQERFGFFHCMMFAWFADLQLHIGQNDLSLLRYARTANMGWTSAGGMFIGHYFAWIVAGLMYAAQLQETGETSVSPGPIAQLVGGYFGLVTIIIAGWSTANPVIYSSGLALQHIFPRMKAWASTIIVGLLATLCACFPALTNGIMELLVFAGILLCPMGVIVATDYFVSPRLGLPQQVALKGGSVRTTNWPAAITWALAEIVSLPVALLTNVSIYFVPLITIALSFALFIAMSKAFVKKGWYTIEENTAEDTDEEEGTVEEPV